MNNKIISALSLLLCLACPLTAQAAIEIPGLSSRPGGAGLTIGNLDNNPRPEMILMVYDMSRQPSSFIYKIGWNLDVNGVTDDWSQGIKIPGTGWEALGAGVTLAQLDNDPRPEMILMIYAFKDDVKPYRYRIGWNLNPDGVTTHWDRDYVEVRGVGWEGGGASLLVTQLDDNPRPELILLAYDVPVFKNYFRYRVGWNLDTNGQPVGWSNYLEAVGVGWIHGRGSGVTIAQLDGNPAPDLVLMAYDSYRKKPDYFRCRVGWNLGGNGRAVDWSDYMELPGVGRELIGADISLFNLDADERPEIIFMGYYRPSKDKEYRFRYQVVRNKVPAKRIYLEMDKLDNVNWPSAPVVRKGGSHSLQGIYATAGIQVKPVKDQGTIGDIKNGQPYSDAEMHSFLTTYRNDKAPAGTGSLYAASLTAHTDGLLGIMFSLDHRRGVVLFANEFNDKAPYLRALAHQLGIALNLNYSDGDAWQGHRMDKWKKGNTIMNPTWKLAPDWNFTWSQASLFHFYNHQVNRWQPREKGIYDDCH